MVLGFTVLEHSIFSKIVMHPWPGHYVESLEGTPAPQKTYLVIPPLRTFVISQ